MEGGRVYAASNTAVLLPCSSDSLWISKSSPLQGDSVSGSKSMVNFEISPGEDKEDNGDEDYDRCFQQLGKKRRLRMDQVKFLERSFEVDNKLEPNRKVNLAKQLGLEPRQVSIWFQNRRARYKTKQLEKDYGSLKASYDKLKADHDGLLKQNEKLKREVHLLSEKLLVKEKGEEMSACDLINSSDVEPQIQIPRTISQDVTNVSMVVCKQEEANSSDSSRIFEPDQSDFSQDEEDNLSRSFLTLPCFPKIEDECCDDFNLGYPVEDQSFWFWSY